MSISALIGNALSSLQTSQTALRVTSNNIANVNTPDYARREVKLSSAVAAGFPSGVEVAEVRRIVNDFFQKEVISTSANAQNYATQTEFHDRLQTLLGRPDDGTSVSAQLATVVAAFNSLAVDTTSVPRRLDVMAELTQLSNMFSNLAQQIQGLRSDANTRLSENISTINNLAAFVHELNPKIQKATLSGDDPSSLMDQRDSAIKSLAGLLDITAVNQSNGAVHISTKSGVSLVGDTLSQLQYNGAAVVTGQTIFPDITVHRVHPVTGQVDPNGLTFNHHISGGELYGLMQMRDQVLPEIAQEVGNLAATIIDGLNAVHNDNVAVPAPASLTGINTGLLAADAHNFTGQTSVSIVSPTGTLISRIDLDFDAGTYVVDGGAPVAFGGATIGDIVTGLNTGLGANGSASFTNGVLTVSANAGNGVGFLQDATIPSSRGGRGFSHFFGLNNLLTASEPSHFDTGLSAADAHGFTGGQTVDFVIRNPAGLTISTVTYTITGGATIGNIVTDLNNAGTGLGAYFTFSLDANGKLNAVPTAGSESLTLDAANDTTTRGGTGASLTRMFGLGRSFQMDQAKDMAIVNRIAIDDRQLGLAKLDLLPATVVGDVVLTRSDNRGAIGLQSVQNTSFQFDAAGGLNATIATLGEYASTLLADAGQRAAQADSFKSGADAQRSEVESRQADLQGVNLDEELSNMMVYQQAYNAAARLIQTANELVETLLNLV